MKRLDTDGSDVALACCGYKAPVRPPRRPEENGAGGRLRSAVTVAVALQALLLALTLGAWTAREREQRARANAPAGVGAPAAPATRTVTSASLPQESWNPELPDAVPVSLSAEEGVRERRDGLGRPKLKKPKKREKPEEWRTRRVRKADRDDEREEDDD